MAAAHCHLTLRASTGVQLSRALFPTVPAGAIPLWKSAAGGRSKYLDMHKSDYSVASAYELISHASEISSKSGRSHAIGMPPFFAR